MFRPYDQKQSFLLPPALSDFLDASHPAHVINDSVERLDLLYVFSDLWNFQHLN